jgi:hypothetical protein
LAKAGRSKHEERTVKKRSGSRFTTAGGSRFAKAEEAGLLKQRKQVF